MHYIMTKKIVCNQPWHFPPPASNPRWAGGQQWQWLRWTAWPSLQCWLAGPQSLDQLALHHLGGWHGQGNTGGFPDGTAQASFSGVSIDQHEGGSGQLVLGQSSPCQAIGVQNTPKLPNIKRQLNCPGFSDWLVFAWKKNPSRKAHLIMCCIIIKVLR